MLKLVEDLRSLRPAHHCLAATASSHCRRTVRLALLLSVGFIVASASSASADADPFYDFLPESLRYEEVSERKPPTISFRRNEARAVEAPTRYPTRSILKYTTPIGRTGLIFQMKARPNLRRIVKLEVRF